MPPTVDIVITCAPSPCDRLSRPPRQVVAPETTTGTPSPWGSRPVGDPAVRPRRTCRARRRPPTHLLDRPRWAALRAREVARSHGSCPGMTRRRFQAPFRRVRTLTSGDWAASNPALAISRGPCGTPPQTPGTTTAFPACSCPLPLSLPGQPGDPRTSFPVPPDCVGDTTKRLAAHTVRAVLPHTAYRRRSPAVFGFSHQDLPALGETTIPYRPISPNSFGVKLSNAHQPKCRLRRWRLLRNRAMRIRT